MNAVRLGTDRTFEQDPKYPIRLLVDIAIKALSPAINDPTTAVQALDQIEDLLLRLGRHDLDSGYASDAKGMPRLVFPIPDLGRLSYARLRRDPSVRRRVGPGDAPPARRPDCTIESLTDADRAGAVRYYLKHLDLAIAQSPLDAQDQAMARETDRQGLGLTRRANG